MQYNPEIHHRKSIRLKGYDYSQPGRYFITPCVHRMRCIFGKIVRTGDPCGRPNNNDIPNNDIPNNDIPNNDKSNNDQIMVLNPFGQIAYDQWYELPKRFTNIELGEFVVMPNHVHGIIIILPPVRATLAVAPNNDNVIENNDPTAPNDDNVTGKTIVQNDISNVNDIGATARVAPTVGKTLGDIVGAYKSLVVHNCLEYIKKQPVEILSFEKGRPRVSPVRKLWQRNYYECIIRDEKSYQNISEYIINNPANWKNDKFFNTM